MSESVGQVSEVEVSAEGRIARITRLHELLFSLNISFALVYGFLHTQTYSAEFTEPLRVTNYWFLRAAVQVNRWLGISSASVSAELTIFLSVFGLATLIWLIVVELRNTRAHRAILKYAGAFSAFFALPIATLTLNKWAGDTVLHGRRIGVMIVAVEAAGLALLLLLARKRRLSTWTMVLFILLHCCFWYFPLYLNSSGQGAILGMRFFRLRALAMLLPVFALAILGWLVYITKLQTASETHFLKRQKRGLRFAFSLLIIVVAALPWLPSHASIHARNPNSVRITLFRPGCFGGCPDYRVEMDGDGTVRYFGQRFVRVHGEQKAAVSQANILSLVETADRLHFYSLEDQAFEGCFDSPWVVVSLSIDGREKTVKSDTSCIARHGPQPEFVNFAEQIDHVAGTEQWVRCETYRCR